MYVDKSVVKASLDNKISADIIKARAIKEIDLIYDDWRDEQEADAVSKKKIADARDTLMKAVVNYAKSMGVPDEAINTKDLLKDMDDLERSAKQAQEAAGFLRELFGPDGLDIELFGSDR